MNEIMKRTCLIVSFIIWWSLVMIHSSVLAVDAFVQKSLAPLYRKICSFRLGLSIYSKSSFFLLFKFIGHCAGSEITSTVSLPSQSDTVWWPEREKKREAETRYTNIIKSIIYSCEKKCHNEYGVYICMLQLISDYW